MEAIHWAWLDLSLWVLFALQYVSFVLLGPMILQMHDSHENYEFKFKRANLLSLVWIWGIFIPTTALAVAEEFGVVEQCDLHLVFSRASLPAQRHELDRKEVEAGWEAQSTCEEGLD